MNPVKMKYPIMKAAHQAKGDALAEVFSQRWKQRLVMVGFIALLLKLYLAWASPGTQDVGTYKNFSDVILRRGGWSLYHSSLATNAAFNYLPFMLYFTRGIRFFSDLTAWPFAFCLRLASVAADVGSTLVLWKIIEERAVAEHQITSQWAYLLYIGAPVTIWVSGFHGNTDSIMMFLLLLSLLFLQRRQAAWMVGLAFGMSLNIKLMPLIFVPLFLLFLNEPRRRLEYSIVVAATIFCAGWPYFFQNPIFIWHRAFGYNGLYGTWGISRWLRLLPPEWGIIDFLFMHNGRFLLLSSLLLNTIWMNRLRRKPDLFQQCTMLMLLFMVLTPAFGIQYLVWLAPLVVALQMSAATIFYIVSGLYVSLNYALVWTKYPVESWPPPFLTKVMVLLEMLCWVSIVVLFIGETRRLSRENSAALLVEPDLSTA